MRRATRRFINHIKAERVMSATTVNAYRDDLRMFIGFLENRGATGLIAEQYSSQSGGGG